MTERTSGVVAQVVLATSCKKQRNKEGQSALSLCVLSYSIRRAFLFVFDVLQQRVCSMGLDRLNELGRTGQLKGRGLCVWYDK